MHLPIRSTPRRLLRDAVLWSGLDARRLIRVARRAPSEQARAIEVLVAPPGGGNIGDQAMVEAYLGQVGGRVTVVTAGVDAISIPAAHAHRASLLPIRGLLYGSRADRARAREEFAALLARARSVSVLGADIMDGLYQPRASVLRAAILEAAARQGVDSRVLGFSWPEHPRAAARRSLAAATRAGAAVLPRDPISSQRLTRDGVRVTRDVADVVFTATDVDDSAFDALELAGPFAIVNTSGHIARSVDLDDDYRAVVEWLRDQGLTVVLLAHVVGTAASDAPPLRRLAAAVGGHGIRLVDTTLSPARVRGLTSRATLTVTGRMHLAIQSLSYGVPAISLASQGKVEGLMELTGTRDLCLTPQPGVAQRIIPLAAAALPPASPAREAIAAALPTIRDLAAGNFAGLQAPTSSPRVGPR